MYPHIISRLRRTPWAATPSAIEAVRDLLNATLSGKLREQPGIDEIAGPNMPLNPGLLASGPLVRRSSQANGFFDDGDSGGRREKKPYRLVDGVAVVPVFGVIGKHLSSLEIYCGGLDVDHLLMVIEQAADDDAAESILLWFNSPGGVVTGLPEAAKRLGAISAGVKSIFAYTDDMCCSAAYWLASQCEGIFSAPSSDVGSIGVYMAWLDMTEGYADAGYHLELIKAGDYKAMGHPLKHLSDEERQFLQGEIDDIYARFTAAVTSQRSQIESSTMQGQTFSFDQQLSTGLVDAHYDTIGEVIASISDAV